MKEITIVVMFLGILIFSSHLFNKMFDRTKIPNVLLLMIIGIIGGFFIDKEIFFGQVGSVFTTITLVIILFESGVNLKFSELKASIGSSFLLTIYNFILTVVAVTAILVFAKGFDLVSGIFVGAILGGTSSAVVIPMIKQLKLGKKSNTTLLLESALSDVLCLIVGLAALEGMRAGALDVASILNSMWKSLLFAALLGLAGGIVWSFILNWMRSLQNSMFTTFAFLFIVYGSVDLLDLNGGIAALCFGIVLGNSESLSNTKLWNQIFKFNIAHLKTNEKDFFSEIVFVLQTYFFVYVGVVIEFGNFITYLLAILIITITLLIRPIGVKLFAKKGCTPKEITVMSIMSPKGLVPAILASLPLQMGLAFGQDIAELGYAVVLLSIFTSSVLIIIVSKDPLIFNKIMRRKREEEHIGGIRDFETDIKIVESNQDIQVSENTEEEPNTATDTHNSQQEEITIKVKNKFGDEFED
ncbi:MAG: cation:proton antiporter [Bacteroidales bacterium]|nr:cation:proton antiporter [Bacteroidales bacterium]